MASAQNSEHINAELGVTWTDGKWRAVLGYRHKIYYGLDADMMFGGPIFGLWYDFGAERAMRP